MKKYITPTMRVHTVSERCSIMCVSGDDWGHHGGHHGHYPPPPPPPPPHWWWFSKETSGEIEFEEE